MKPKYTRRSTDIAGENIIDSVVNEFQREREYFRESFESLAKATDRRFEKLSLDIKDLASATSHQIEQLTKYVDKKTEKDPHVWRDYFKALWPVVIGVGMLVFAVIQMQLSPLKVDLDNMSKIATTHIESDGHFWAVNNHYKIDNELKNLTGQMKEMKQDLIDRTKDRFYKSDFEREYNSIDKRLDLLEGRASQ